MKINRFSIAIALIAVLSPWTDNGDTVVQPKLVSCKGYTIIEYGTALNCNGDTITLEKIGGVQVMALTYKDKKHRYW